MPLKLSELKGYEIAATDGTLGKIGDVFFDDHSWTVRYLVVDTGWLFGRKVLISPEAISEVNIGDGTVAVNITKEQIESAPSADTDRPVSRQEEVALREHHGWQRYWDMYPAGMAGAAAMPLLVGSAIRHYDMPADRTKEMERQQGDPNLRSAGEVEGYGVHVSDGEIGHVEDIMIDEIAWVVRYFVIDTRNWFPGGRKVLISPAWATGINWRDRSVEVKATKDQVKNGPEYDPDAPLTRETETAMHDHYEMLYYWR